LTGLDDSASADEGLRPALERDEFFRTQTAEAAFRLWSDPSRLISFPAAQTMDMTQNGSPCRGLGDCPIHLAFLSLFCAWKCGRSAIDVQRGNVIKIPEVRFFANRSGLTLPNDGGKEVPCGKTRGRRLAAGIFAIHSYVRETFFFRRTGGSFGRSNFWSVRRKKLKHQRFFLVYSSLAGPDQAGLSMN